MDQEMQDSSYEDDHPETNQPNNQPITPRPSHGSTVKSLAVTVLGFLSGLDHSPWSSMPKPEDVRWTLDFQEAQLHIDGLLFSELGGPCARVGGAGR